MYELLKQDGRAKRGIFHTVHGDIQTPTCANGTIGTRFAARRTTLTAHRLRVRKNSLRPTPRGDKSSAAARRCPRPKSWLRFDAARARFRSRESSAAVVPAWVGVRAAFARAAWWRFWRASWAATPAKCCWRMPVLGWSKDH